MISFFVCLALLIGGFMVYSKVAEKVFGPDDRKPPALTMTDGSDYVPMGTPRIFLIQLLNIAGLGPIFGALAGACWGPSVFLWITFGTLLGGGVHDYMVGMMSMRHKGASVSELTGTYLGDAMKQVMRVFSVVLLVLVGVSFSTGPANLLAMLTPQVLDAKFWLVVVLVYYFIATFVPIDKVIGKIYPIFGICLIVMALGVGGAILLGGYHIPEISLTTCILPAPPSGRPCSYPLPAAPSPVSMQPSLPSWRAVLPMKKTDAGYSTAPWSLKALLP